MESLWYHFAELAVQFLKLAGFFVAVILPATWVCVRRIADLSLAARVGIGVSLGFALFVVSAWYAGLWSLDYPVAFWLLQFPVAAWLGRFSEGTRPPLPIGDRLPVRPGGESEVGGRDAGVIGRSSKSWFVFLPLLAGVLLQLYAVQFSELPHGVDSSFHCVVAQRLVDVGHVTRDLWPLEDVKLNYPVGSHLWVAVASRWTGLRIHEVFSQSFAIALFGAGLVVAAWGERLCGTPRHGAAAAFAFVFCSFQASLYPYTWGGLPSLMAMWLGMAALFCVVSLRGPGGFATSALLFAATAMVHHHTMVALLGGAGLVSLVGLVFASSLRDAWRRTLLALASGMAIASVYALPLALRVLDLGRVGILRFTEPFAWPWEHYWIWKDDPFINGLTVVSAAATLGATVLGVAIVWRSAARAPRAMLIGLAVLWMLSFCLLDYGGRLVAHALHRESIQPFTPSRFLFDTHFAVAVFVGAGLERVWVWMRRAAFRYALVSVLACGAIEQIEPRWRPEADDALIPLGRWADRNLPPDALISGSASVWVTYTFHRESASLFVPVSEPVEPNRFRKKKLLLFYAGTQSWSQWRQLLQKPIYIISLSDRGAADLPPLVAAGRYALYDVNND
jgi:hypothetical protein